MKKIKYYWNTTIDDVKEHLVSGIKYLKGYYPETEKIYFYCKDGFMVKMFHDQECCEWVYLQDDDGLDNEVDIFTDCDWCVIEEEIYEHDGKNKLEPLDKDDGSYTWTFYKFKTNKGYDTMRWYGTSNGYYSESVDFEIYGEENYETN